uniref:WH2 domain-containing protein n=1 Tax=Anopheles atroparvus TaxID=41427 RepID=A0A182IRJ0_ANOAO
MNGLSTLNRLLGKRNKDVSKSTSNLSRSTTNLEASSHYNNRIIQLPVVANAPFEQTFRVTVLLPRDQLYVARVGAKTKLSTLLEMVCNDKLLDAQKYLFRHPADFQQGFELDMNIGEVGLSEIRLMSRKELETMRNSDYRLSTSDIFRMHQKSARETSGGGGGGGASVTSSDLSRTSKLPLKTTSPYSSTNSLNSMDSSGVSSSSRGAPTTNGHAGNGQHHPMGPPVAPTRKKRLAPRPPSQNSIPEVRVPQHTTNGSADEKPAGPEDHIFKEPQLPPYSRSNFHVSTPDLYDRELKSVDIMNNNHSNNNNVPLAKASNGEQNGYAVEANNNNHERHDGILQEEDRKNLINTTTSYSTLKNRPTSMYIIREPDPAATLHRTSENGGSMVDIHQHSRASSSCSDAKDPRDFHDMPEPTPRKRLNSSAKKSKAPAPPPRAKTTTITPVPTPSPRALTRSTLDLLRDNDAAISETDSNFSSEPDDTQRNRESRLNAVNGSVHRAPSSAHQNVSKVMLNVEQASPLNDPVVTSTTPDVAGERKHQKTGSTSSSVSIKIIGQAAIEQQREPKVASTPAPIVSKVQIGGSQNAQKAPVPPTSPGDNSSDEEIKIYNIESGKAVVKKRGVELAEERAKVTSTNGVNGEKSTNQVLLDRPAQNGEKQEAIDSQASTNGQQEEEQWTYRLPAPPTFADASIKSSDYDERGQFYRPASTFVDNTTLRSDMMTVVSDEMTERIEPFIQERLQTMLDLVEGREGAQADFFTPAQTRIGRESPESVSTEAAQEVAAHVSSDVEDGYRVGASEVAADSTQVARDVWLQTLEKRREKIIEGELATLSESIGGKSNATSGSALVTRTESVNDRKGNELMSELNQLLRDGVELSRTEKQEIAVVNRSSLANFKISTYSSSENKENVITTSTNTTTVSTVLEKREREHHQQEEVKEVVSMAPVAKNGINAEASPTEEAAEEVGVIVRRKISADSIFRKPHSLTQSSDEDDPAAVRNTNGAYQPGGSAKKELAPVKRRSLTMLNKSPRGINRSDSFHSTRSDYIQSLNSPAQTATTSTKLQLTPRSTSYISLIGAQRWENRGVAPSNGLSGAPAFNRRMSTSELSISDSPSLQSLEVIKNILNTSRKNSMNNLHQQGSSEQRLGGSSSEEIALPSMAAIKRNSFTDISTLAQLNGKAQMGGGMAVGNVRKDSIEEAKVEQEPEQEQVELKQELKSKELIKEEETKKEVVERIVVEARVEKIVDEQEKQKLVEEVIKKEVEPVELRKKEVVQPVKEPTMDLNLTSESKSDDEKLQNKQQQQQHQGVALAAGKESQTTVISITTNSTVVSSSNSTSATGVTPANESDTKKWTYQGPPTISFATWNERPKIDVSIKSDRDYRFGGSSTLPRGFRNVNNVSSTKISIGPGGSSTTTTNSSTAEASTTGYVRRTIHEVDQQQQQQQSQHDVAPNVPSTASQERHQESPAIVKLPATPPKPAGTSTGTPPGERLPIVRAVEYKKNVTTRQPPPPVEPKPSYFYETFSRNESTTSSGRSSIVSVNGSAPASTPSTASTTTSISRLSFGPKPPTVLQPTVRGFKSLDENAVAPSGASGLARLRPVSMIDTGTLRKTTVALAGPPAEDTAPNSLPFSQNTLRRTGLKDRILAKESTPASEPPVVRGAIVKKSPTAATSPAIDPRTALLDAIRNFNKNSLKKD